MAGRRSAIPDGVVGTVRAIARGGDAVVVTEHGIVLAAGAAPGERVRLRAVTFEGKVLRGRVAEVLTPSPSRVEPPCVLAARCGGCPLMHLDEGAQRAAKLELVRDAMRSVAPDLEVELVPAVARVGYRRRARLAWKRLRSTLVVGYRARRAHEIVDVASCPVLDPALDRALAMVRARVASELAGEGELALALGANGAAAVVLTTRSAQTPGAYRAAEALASDPAIAGVLLDVGGSAAAFGDPREHSVAIDGLPLVGPPAGFSQAHEAVNDALASYVVELAAPHGARVLELYCGHGNLTVALAAEAESLVAVEQDAAAAAACGENLRSRHLDRARVVAADAVGHADGPRVDVVVLDPPRDGARGALEGIARRRPERIVYVSCDTATLGRDLGVLASLGWVVDRARAFDMFPQTAHVEVVVRLCPRERTPRLAPVPSER